MKIFRKIHGFAVGASMTCLILAAAAQSAYAAHLTGFPNQAPNPTPSVENDGAFIDMSLGLATLTNPSDTNGTGEEVDADHSVSNLPTGLYTLSVKGADTYNNLFLNTNYVMSGGSEPEKCLVIIDEEGIDCDMLTIVKAADAHGITPDELSNDQGQRHDPLFGDISIPTDEKGNPWFTWNEIGTGDIVKLPTGQVDDEGWFALPEKVRYFDGAVDFPQNPITPYMEFPDFNGNTVFEITNSQQWLAGFSWGVIPKDKLDKVLDVMPLHNQDLAALVGKSCTAVVYDSDISMNYDAPEYQGDKKIKGVNANLQGGRRELFTFTVLAVEVPGGIGDNTCTSTSTIVDGQTIASDGEWPCELPESMSDTTLYDVWLRIEEPMRPEFAYHVQPRS